MIAPRIDQLPAKVDELGTLVGPDNRIRHHMSKRGLGHRFGNCRHLLGRPRAKGCAEAVDSESTRLCLHYFEEGHIA